MILKEHNLQTWKTMSIGHCCICVYVCFRWSLQCRDTVRLRFSGLSWWTRPFIWRTWLRVRAAQCASSSTASPQCNTTAGSADIFTLPLLVSSHSMLISNSEIETKFVYSIIKLKFRWLPVVFSSADRNLIFIIFIPALFWSVFFNTLNCFATSVRPVWSNRARLQFGDLVKLLIQRYDRSA